MEIFRQDMDSLPKTLENIWRNTHKSLEELLPETAYWAIVGATKATGPGDRSRVSKLQRKYKLRPVVSKKVFAGKRLYTREGLAYAFEIKKALSAESMQKHGLRRITKAVKKWSKKEKAFVFPPYLKEKTDKSDKELKIPHAGAAKYGWLANLKSLGLKTSGTDPGTLEGEIRRPAYANQRKYGLTESFIIMDNLIDYISTISPQSAEIGMQKASHKMYGIYLKKLEEETAKGNAA